MKNSVWGFAIAAVLLSTGISLAADVTGQTGFEFDWWKDSEKNTGYQGFIPLKVSAQMKEFSVSVLGGYAYTGYDQKAGEDVSISHSLDTKINLSYEILDKLPFDVLLGLDVNLPTGKTALRQKELVLIMDPDLVSITNLGEGYDINPTLSVAKEWGNLVAGLGIGYLFRGDYDFTKDVRDYDPGDIFTTTAEVRYDFSPSWTARLLGQYARYGKSEVQDHAFYKEGDFYLLGLGLRYIQKRWDTTFTLRYIFRGKSELQDMSGDLARPDSNIHGNEWIGDVILRYLVNDRTTLWTKVEGLILQENGFPSDSPFFVGQRAKISLEVGGSRTLGDHFEAGLFVRGFTMHDEQTRYPEFLGERTYNGFSVGGNLIARF